jgi:hypothetical protein
MTDINAAIRGECPPPDWWIGEPLPADPHVESPVWPEFGDLVPEKAHGVGRGDTGRRVRPHIELDEG